MKDGSWAEISDGEGPVNLDSFGFGIANVTFRDGNVGDTDPTALGGFQLLLHCLPLAMRDAVQGNRESGDDRCGHSSNERRIWVPSFDFSEEPSPRSFIN